MSRKINRPANDGTTRCSGQGKKPNRGGPGRGRATTPRGRNVKPNRRGSPGGGISGRRGTACRAPASAGDAQASSVRGVRPSSAGTHTGCAKKFAAATANPAPPLAGSRPRGLWGVSVATAARLLGVSRRSVQYMLEDGRLEGTRIPPRGWWRISRASLARLIPPGSLQ